MDTQPIGRRIARRYAYRGQRVTVTRRSDGTTVTGTLLGWGPSELRLRADDGAYVALASACVAGVHEVA